MRGRARLRAINESGVLADVSGKTGNYEVEIGFDQVSHGALRVSCDCMRYDDGYPCKHLWAALLELDEALELELDGATLFLEMLEPGNVLSGVRDRRRFDDDDPPVLRHGANSTPTKKRKAAEKKKEARRQRSSWSTHFQLMERMFTTDEIRTPSALQRLTSSATRTLFVLCQDQLAATSKLILNTYQSTRKKDGEWSVPQRKSFGQSFATHSTASEDLSLLKLLDPWVEDDDFRSYGYGMSSEFIVPESQPPGAVLSRLAAAGRLAWSLSSIQSLHDPVMLSWEDGVCQFRLRIELDQAGHNKSVRIRPEITLASDRLIELAGVTAVYSEGVLLRENKAYPMERNDAKWASVWHRSDELTVPFSERDEFFAQFCRLPSPPKFEVDPQLKLKIETGQPTGRAVIAAAESSPGDVTVEPQFKYGNESLPLGNGDRLLWDPDKKRIVLRDKQAELELVQTLQKYSFRAKYRSSYRSPTDEVLLPLKQVPAMTYELVEQGWEVVAHGKLIRKSGEIDIRVKSEQDWFDLEADVDYDGVSASLPALLKALQQKSRVIQLDDGSQGLLPEEWLKRYAKFAELGQIDGDKVQFAKPQALLLDSMLAEQQHVSVDKDFTKLCRKMRNFDGIKPGKEPRGFQGELRDYQRDGVGWFGFLREFGFGGCLADDMGLGKTVQVLALLQQRRNRRLKEKETRLPSIVVVPKSLVYNWLEEAERFAPKLTALNYTGLNRDERLPLLEKADLVVTTYGTLRRDIRRLNKQQFDYVILDEAQAVKNSKSQAAKACRLLKGQHRLAMTGTPVENHVGELWSLFDFLNPGMFGSMTAFRKITGRKRDEEEDETLEWLARSIRPFILRRTKGQVLKELPDKTEQTLRVDMNAKQAKKYGELRDYYRVNLSKKVKDVGIKRSKIHVLEALLRLRQAACDPRLLGSDQPVGAKLELMMEQLESLHADGHKALVFSQFTSLLALVRKELDARNWDYEYLDGKTRKRQEKVERFQTDKDCGLFLISLKAGGSGLNLTAAEYVFILDPWWNPAVEAQAIDRAHRIGQTRNVMAYRIICNDTVEDKILRLQTSKRDLADAIITADKSLISELSLDDLQMLLT